jgi:hypothetical protein
MIIKNIGHNAIEVELLDLRILYSRRRPVAYFCDGRFFVSESLPFPSTARHISEWARGAPVTTVPQEEIENLLRF